MAQSLQQGGPSLDAVLPGTDGSKSLTASPKQHKVLGKGC
jgi:hypothetical protein